MGGEPPRDMVDMLQTAHLEYFSKAEGLVQGLGVTAQASLIPSGTGAQIHGLKAVVTQASIRAPTISFWPWYTAVCPLAPQEVLSASCPSARPQTPVFHSCSTS